MIDIRKLKELVRLMVADATELDLRDSEEQVTLRRGASGGPGGHAHAGLAPPMVTAAPAPATTPLGGGAAAEAPPADDEGLARIDSPMVGTFYAAPNPDAPPFVTVGSVVEPETVVCIMEAMKIFNEIRADVGGTVQRILVKNGEAVEYGQTLFLVKPD